MKLSIVYLDGKREQLEVPAPGSRFVDVARRCECGSAVVCNVTTWQIQGEGWSDTYAVEAICAGRAGCGVKRGVLELVMDTLFGVREDEAVLNGRARVY